MTLKKAGYLLLTGFILMWAVFTTGWLMTERRANKALMQDSISKQETIDSLGAECSAKDIEVGRYEIILDRISDVDSAIVEDAMSDVE